MNMWRIYVYTPVEMSSEAPQWSTNRLPVQQAQNMPTGYDYQPPCRLVGCGLETGEVRHCSRGVDVERRASGPRGKRIT